MDSLLELTFTVNGTTITDRVEGRKTLLRYLRDDLGLMGTKDGCTSGDCGSCVVQVDGKTVDSCVYLMRRANGVAIETIDGLARPDGTLHPIQAAFLEKGAVQCGFCIPGMIMASEGPPRVDPLPHDAADPRGPEGQHLSLHGVRADLRRRPAGGRVARRPGLVRGLAADLWPDRDAGRARRRHEERPGQARRTPTTSSCPACSMARSSGPTTRTPTS